ncbi:MAG: ABC transporter ATP-binding protein [Alkalispirochaeta sp.]
MIEVYNLSFAYPRNEKPTLHGLDFTIQPGEIFGFLGPSGAGKSTTQKILIGLLRGFQGSVVVNGMHLGALGPDFYEQIGVSFETPNLFGKLTGLENLRFFASLYTGATESPETLLQRVGLDAAGAQRVAEYSKGMKGRLSVARSLINRPRILFLDEPTAGLDPANARLMKDLIQETRSGGTTVFLTTHNMTVADELCDRVAFIAEGKLAVIDSPRNLKIKYGKKIVRVEYRNTGTTRTVDFSFDGIGENDAFLTLLRRERIETIHSLEASLEDIFIQLTGTSLSGSGAVHGDMR